MNITKTTYGMTHNNETISLYRMENENGAYVSIIDYGCRIVDISVPDKNGELRNVVLGYSSIEEYEKDTSFFGSVPGRFANRICKGKFTLNGVEYQLAQNDGENHLHGGPTGFADRVWNGKIEDDKVIFSRLSADGEEGYPGNLNVSVIYSFSADNELSITYEAESDKDTILNITNHAYFNLNGEGSGDIKSHELYLDADHTTEVDSGLIPTGKILSVEHTPFDFRKSKPVGQDMVNQDPQFNIPGTYDHNFVLNGSGLREAAILQSNESGIRLTCLTDQPGIQIFVPANPITDNGTSGRPYGVASGICLETQHFPDSINHDNFPSVVLKAGTNFKSKTLFHFSTL